MSRVDFPYEIKKKGLIKVDPRTLLYLILVSNLSIFLMPSAAGELLLMCGILLLGVLCGVYGFSVKAGIAHLIFWGADYLICAYFGSTWLIYVAVGLRFIRKVLPTGLLGGILVMTTSVSEMMASLGKMRVPRTVTIPITVLMRYFPSVKEERQAIKNAMALRGLSGGFFRHPMQSIECLYVPLLMSASRRADELSAAAATRGIENPKPRTMLYDVHFGIADLCCALLGTALACFCMWGGGFG